MKRRKRKKGREEEEEGRVGKKKGGRKELEERERVRGELERIVGKERVGWRLMVRVRERWWRVRGGKRG